MAKPATVRIFVSRFRTKKQQQLLALLNNKNIKKQVNTIIKDEINQFVPMRSGALRASAQVTPESISWGRGLKYAGYQYRGDVYVPNRPITKGGQIVGWYTPAGTTKHLHPEGKKLGTPGEWKGWKFGYFTPDTHYHWDKYFTDSAKRRAGLEITKMLKRECRQRGLKV